MDGSTNVYQWQAMWNLTAAQLLPMAIVANVAPELLTGQKYANAPTNLIISFTLNTSMQFKSTLTFGSKIVITDTAGIFALQRGCTVLSSSTPTYVFDCVIINNQLIISNPRISIFTTSSQMSVIFGSINPTTSNTFTISLYEYYYSSTSYGISASGTCTYTPLIPTTISNIQSRNQIRMNPFNTLVYSSVASPFRIGFKLSTTPSLPTSLSYLTNSFTLVDLAILSPYTAYECIFKQYNSPFIATSPFSTSYQNYLQRTDYIVLDSLCALGNSTSLNVWLPNILLYASYYY